MSTFVFDFTQGNKDLKDLLGGKGANLAEMTRLGLPVPPGFTISTEACRAYLAHGREPDQLAAEVTQHLRALEQRMGRPLGDPLDPLLVSVRSGAKFSMPGMMETVLDIGLNDESVVGLARQSGDERFATDSYRRLLQMFGTTVLGLDAADFSSRLDDLKQVRGAAADTDLDVDDLRSLVDAFKSVIRERTGGDFPQDPDRQLRLAIRAVFTSWNTPRAALYRRQEQIPDDLGTAVNVQAMVFGNRGGASSGSGVCFTRDPATGEKGVYGDYLQNAQGEDVVAGIRNAMPLADLADLDRTSYEELLLIMQVLERHYRDMCDLEFTIEDGRLWMLQTRVGKRTPDAAVRIACALVDEGLIDLDEALLRVTGPQVASLMFPRFAADPDRHPVAVGMSASPGAAVGRVVFDSPTAVAWTGRGEDVILVRKETNPDDLAGMVVARGILTSRGGKTSHAAVVARGMGRTCVCGCESIDVDLPHRRFQVRGGPLVQEGDVISIDGSTGEVFLGAVPVSDSALVRRLEGEQTDSAVAASVARLLVHADARRRLGVRANADTPTDARRARRFGASGIGLCRTEHMFLGERRELVEHLIVAADETSQTVALDKLLPLQRADFTEILEAMDGLPVTIRLLDPPLHEFLPDLTELAVQVALEDERFTVDEHDHRLLTAVRRLHEQNPMLGLRGVRLGIVIPGLFAMQARAIAEAAADRTAAGGDPRPEIMVPLVASERELALVRTQLDQVVAAVAAERGVGLALPIGTMIELPRAAVTADRIAASADFFSFGTNDLTQMTWGFSRDDVEASFFPTYLDHGIFAVSPFESLDVEGVGSLVRTAARLGRQAHPGLHLGVCGEHGGDPASIHFFDEIGLDYVSCSPFRVPVARLEAARSALLGAEREPLPDDS
ncbi:MULTISPECIES: pyruvate, phosphate dikinase [unclassified Nocardioides]|uniref:pyruvate, phosphate dikinase n=1 Tax=unclassified Nocardioides TaxID=2615069 RepID=UPI0009F138ED|nr:MULTISPECIES: pyruvate, phosphate dikinase [unclassified Nocardioides]GAW50883.1 pyruvate phosphate dikinase [Nocardioides sp. PD653-B2]GAW54041.1 pyruvate phosphate dikinase [Nocardioides sp. PD653]